MRRASSVTPPTAPIASWSPRSAMLHMVVVIPLAPSPPSANRKFFQRRGYRRVGAVVNSRRLYRWVNAGQGLRGGVVFLRCVIFVPIGFSRIRDFGPGSFEKRIS